MTIRRYTKEHTDYVRSIAKGRYNDEITEMFNKKFKVRKSVSAIKALKANYKIVSNVSTGSRKREKIFSVEQEEFLKNNVKGIGNKELTELFNEKFNTSFLVTQVISWKNRNKISSGLDGRFVKGQESWNKGMKGLNLGGEKGWFKKGQDPINYRPVGSERIDSKDGYTIIKVQDEGTWPERWRHKHVVLWEEANGKTPENHVIVFADSDKENIVLDNLLLLSRSELARMNQGALFFDDPELTKTGLNIVRLNNKITDIEIYGGDREKFQKYIKIAESRGLTEPTFIARLKRGWSLEDSLNRPLHSHRRKKKERSVSN